MNIEIATVPAKAPRSKIYVAIRAIISVGNVLIILKINLTVSNNGLLWLTFTDASIAKGRAIVEPTTEPKIDILIVSKRGETTSEA